MSTPVRGGIGNYYVTRRKRKNQVRMVGTIERGSCYPAHSVEVDRTVVTFELIDPDDDGTKQAVLEGMHKLESGAVIVIESTNRRSGGQWWYWKLIT